jgi:hypothetical protein
MRQMTLYELVDELTNIGKEIERLGFRTDKARTVKMFQESIDGKLFPLDSKEISLNTIKGELVAVIKNKKL